MTREFYLKRDDALNAANQMVSETRGFMTTTTTSNQPWDYISRDALDLDWGGETEAFRTYDEDGRETGIFAWWED